MFISIHLINLISFFTGLQVPVLDTSNAFLGHQHRDFWQKGTPTLNSFVENDDEGKSVLN